MSNERHLSIDCQSDALSAVLHVPAGQSRDVGVLFAVGGPQYRIGSHRQFVLMARAFASGGYPVLRFDYRGMGDSTGVSRAFDEVDDDIQAAVDAFLKEVPGLSRVVLFGLCDAASAALIYCGRDPRIAGLLLANPWVRTQGAEAKAIVRHYYRQRLMQRDFWKKALSGSFNPAGALRSLLANLRKAGQRDATDLAAASKPHFIERMRLGLQAFRGPVLLLMSGRDLTAREFQDLCGSAPEWRALVQSGNVRTVEFTAADHTFSSCLALRDAVEASLGWLDSAVSRKR